MRRPIVFIVVIAMLSLLVGIISLGRQTYIQRDENKSVEGNVSTEDLLDIEGSEGEVLSF